MAGAERPLVGPVPGEAHASGARADAGPANVIPSFGRLWEAVRAAADDLYARDLDLLGTTERAVVGRLMVYLDKHLAGLSQSGLVLDQDYERAGQVTKRLVGTGLPDRKVVPDLVFHRRHDQGPAGNVLAMEVKTDSRLDGRLHDFAKLSILTGHVTEVIAYDKCLRMPGDPAPLGQSEKGTVSLPDGMHPYRYGLWLLLKPNGAQCCWWSNRKGPRGLSYTVGS
jgi:hypothetical protein